MPVDLRNQGNQADCSQSLKSALVLTFIRIKASDVAWHAIWITRAVQSKWADTEHGSRLGGMDQAVDPLDYPVDF